MVYVYGLGLNLITVTSIKMFCMLGFSIERVVVVSSLIAIYPIGFPPMGVVGCSNDKATDL